MITCRNCKRSFEGNYCPNCGQKPNSGRIILKESIHDVLEHYFDFDAPLFRTFFGLIKRPGKVVREYIFGRRKSYAHPIRFYILALAIYVILQNVLNFDPIQTFGKIVGASEEPDPNNIATKGSYLFRDNINLFILYFGLFLAFLNRIFFRKSNFTISEYLALAFYIIGEYILIACFLILLVLISPYFFLLNYLLVLFYPIYVMYNFHDGRKVGRLFKAFIVSILSWFLYVAAGQFTAIQIVKTFGL